MEQINELSQSLNQYFGWNKARMTIFCQMLLGLILGRTVNLNKVACLIISDSKKESRYRRLQRFFSGFHIDFEKIAGFLFKLFFVSGGEWYLTVDRTNWQWGKSNINILTLAIAFKGVAIPIYWALLDKKGNSDTVERIQLIERFIKQFGKSCIAGILADREFVGEKWFKWLADEKIIFYFRAKKNFLTTDSRGRPAHLKTLFRGLRLQEERVLYGQRKILGQSLYIAGLQLGDGELLIVVTNTTPGNAILIYALRWEIETLFGCLKSKGFHFEDTHMIEPERIKKLLAVLAIAFCWAHKTGEWQHEIEPIKIKKHGRPAVSLFRYGLDYLIQVILNLFRNPSAFAECLAKIKPPPLDLAVTGVME